MNQFAEGEDAANFPEENKELNGDKEAKLESKPESNNKNKKTYIKQATEI